MLPAALARAALTDAEWERVRWIVPPQQPRIGRRRHDHRTVINAILTVVGTDLSWREIPEEYGKWGTAYKRYRLWCDTGLWQCIVTALGARTQK
jgi:transposase